VKAIHRKMLRELKEMRSQAVAIGFVIVAGVATFVSMTSIYESLELTLANYYDEHRFADGFVSILRAPEHLARRLQEVPGVNEVQTRVVAAVNLEVGGFDQPVTGVVVSLPAGRQPTLNQVYLREGRLPEGGREDEVLLNEVFAEAHGLQPGDELTAIIRGSRRTLAVVGIALSPEYLMQVQPGTIFPDPERHGVLWMEREALAAAYDMQGAFNDASFTLAPGAAVEEVIHRMDAFLDPYGGRGAYPRADQVSHNMIQEEFNQLRGMATLLPIIFLGVAAFLLNIVITRLIILQRQMIAILKAFGYRNRDVVLHYLSFVLVIATAGTGVGMLLGVWLGHLLGDLYLEFYRFPAIDYVLSLRVALTAVLLTLGAAAAGVLMAVRRAVRLQPAEAMRPAQPTAFRRTLLERLGLQRFFDQPTRIILRNLERQPLKSMATVLGISLASALMIMGSFSQDSLDYIADVQFGLAQREHFAVSFTDPASMSALHDLRTLPGVLHAEPYRTVPVRLRHGHRSYQTGIEGIPRGAYLRRVLDADLNPITVPDEGIVLATGLAEVLEAGVGDRVTVEVQEGRRRTVELVVTGVAEQFIGVGAYMELGAANRLAGGGEAISGGYLLVDEAREGELMAALRERPRVAGISSTDQMLEAFYEDMVGALIVFTIILSLFAAIIAFGVIYNGARISLSERDRELASLRVLGFTRGEISYIMLGEIAVLVVAAIPLGLLLGWAGSYLTVSAIQTELLRLPVVLQRDTFALAAIIVLASGLVSALLIRRRLLRLDLIAVLKTRE
jgi:putative ABC transport system permease protein